MGARAIEGSPADRHGPYTLTIDASMTAEGLACAVRSTEAEGTCHSVCLHFAPLPVPVLDMYTNGITLKLGLPHVGSAFPAVFELIEAGRLQPDLIVSATAQWQDAIDALTDGTTSKLVITRTA